MWRRIAKRRAPRSFASLLASVCLVALLVFVSGSAAEASWSHIEGHSEILAASSSPVSTLIKQTVGQTVSLLMLAVAIIIGVPVVIAGLAFSVSFVLSRAGRRLHKRRVPAGALSRAS